MAFIRSNNNVISFAEYQDVLDADQRLFETNEGLTDDYVETVLIRSTEIVLDKIRATAWWRDYYVSRSSTPLSNPADLPTPDANRILERQNDFTDLCVAIALSEYILPRIADFGAADNAEMAKMGHYAQRASRILADLIQAGDWYDFNNTGTITSEERQLGIYNLRRIR